MVLDELTESPWRMVTRSRAKRPLASWHCWHVVSIWILSSSLNRHPSHFFGYIEFVRIGCNAPTKQWRQKNS
eukprot:scaffold9760_cov117-Alexandrium_tamarense.AAC.6